MWSYPPPEKLKQSPEASVESEEFIGVAKKKKKKIQEDKHEDATEKTQPFGMYAWHHHHTHNR